MEKKFKVAFVEDDEVLSKIFKEEMESSGIEVFQAFDGEEGLNVVKKEKPDLVLLDIIMPKMDGVALLKKIKMDDEIKNIPVVMLTVFGDYGKIADTLELGAKAYFIKDQQKMKDIIEAVKKMLTESI